ncbi:MAG: glycosyltransferase family 39 protein, partial [Candidatus Omnitrophota bacterium]|nr:glycosyltransferase family 39 protein [Candidatus Omnitrophota bacterium]
MDKILERPLLPILIIILLCGYLFFFRLGGMALTDPDETFYAQTAKEMLDRGEWATPYLYGRPQFEKPVFFYWLVELSYRIFGVNEFAARFPSAVFALIGVLAMYLLGSIIFNPRTGFLACLMLATNVEYVILSRACVTDMVLFTFLLCGALFFLCGHLKDKARFYVLSSAAFGFATLTKGPVFLVLPLAVITIYLAFLKGFKILKKIPLFWCALAFLAVVAPWYLLIYKLHGKEFIDVFFGFHNVTRFMESEHKIGSQIYYNIPIILGGYFPWSVFLPFGLWHAFKKVQKATAQLPEVLSSSLRGRSPKQSLFYKEIASVAPSELPRNDGFSLLFILIWFFVIFIFFTASSTKLPTYVFPSFLSLAIIT